jgi:CubicO group peptidase (beta-lactamase class C family)
MKTIWKSAAKLPVMLASRLSRPKSRRPLAKGDYGFVREYISWLVKREMKKHDVTGISIALLDDQEVVWAQGFGFADKAVKLPATPGTIYRAGSITKLFTATAAMQLMEQGKLDIDQPLQTYLPDFSIRSRLKNTGPITPRNIMAHHSGLPCDYLKGFFSIHPESRADLVDLLRNEYTAHPPNHLLSYSNVGFSLLGDMLERITGKEYATLMGSLLLNPLEMTHSALSAGSDRSAMAAKAYFEGKEGVEPFLRDIPAGGLNTTVMDLCRFMRMVFANGRAEGRPIVKPETLAEMLRPQNTDVALDLDKRVGLAWGIGNLQIADAGPVAGHSGSTMHHNSVLIVLSEHKLGVVLLSNSATAGSMVGKAATETLKLALEAKTGIKRKAAAVKSAKPENLPPHKDLLALEGSYATEFGVVRVAKKSRHLQARIVGVDKIFRLVQRRDGLIRLQRRLFGVFPLNRGGQLNEAGWSRATVAGHEIVKISLHGRETLIGERIQKTAIPESWQKQCGEYKVINAGQDALSIDKVRLSFDRGLLLVEAALEPRKLFGKTIFAIAPYSETEAVICGLGRNMGETIRVVRLGGEAMLQYSGYIFKRKK